MSAINIAEADLRRKPHQVAQERTETAAGEVLARYGLKQYLDGRSGAGFWGDIARVQAVLCKAVAASVPWRAMDLAVRMAVTNTAPDVEIIPALLERAADFWRGGLSEPAYSGTAADVIRTIAPEVFADVEALRAAGIYGGEWPASVAGLLAVAGIPAVAVETGAGA